MSRGKKYRAQSDVADIQKALGNLTDDQCLFCHSSEINENVYGKYIKSSGLTLHYFCMLFASGLSQRGQTDKHGIYGFIFEDIIRELRRGIRLKCTFCKSKGATIGCVVGKCRYVFHYSCGRKHNTMHQFFDTFSSFCKDHRPQQTLSTSDCLTFTGTATTTCAVCMNPVEARASVDTLRTPCCRGSWFHRECIEKHALTAGLYFFKCPLCNNKEQFQNEMLKFGVYIPDQDAAWEMEPNAFSDLLERYMQCDAYECRCHNGRRYNKDGGKWEILVCDWCGSKGSHVACHSLLKLKDDYICQDCKLIEEKYKKGPDGKSRKLKCERVLPGPRGGKKNLDFDMMNKSKSEYQQQQEKQSNVSLPQGNLGLSSPDIFASETKSPLKLTGSEASSEELKSSRFYYYKIENSDSEDEVPLQDISNRKKRRLKRKRVEQVELRKSLNLEIDMAWNDVDSDEEQRPWKLRRKSSVLDPSSAESDSKRCVIKKCKRKSQSSCTVSAISMQADKLSKDGHTIAPSSTAVSSSTVTEDSVSYNAVDDDSKLSADLSTKSYSEIHSEENLSLSNQHKPTKQAGTVDTSIDSRSDSDLEIPLAEFIKMKNGRNTGSHTIAKVTNLQSVSYETYLKELAGCSTEHLSCQEVTTQAADIKNVNVDGTTDSTGNYVEVKGQTKTNLDKNKHIIKKKKKKKIDINQMSIKQWLKSNANKSSAEESSATEDEGSTLLASTETSTSVKSSEEKRTLKIRWKGRTFYFKRTIHAGSAFKENMNVGRNPGDNRSRYHDKKSGKVMKGRNCKKDKKPVSIESVPSQDLKMDLCEGSLVFKTPERNFRRPLRSAFTEKKRNILKDRNISSPHTLPKLKKKSKFIEALVKFPDETINSCNKTFKQLSRVTRCSLTEKFQDSSHKFHLINSNDKPPVLKNDNENLKRGMFNVDVAETDMDIVVLTDVSRENPEMSPVGDSYQCMLVDLGTENLEDKTLPSLSPIEISFDDFSMTENEADDITLSGSEGIVSPSLPIMI